MPLVLSGLSGEPNPNHASDGVQSTGVLAENQGAGDNSITNSAESSP